VNDVPVINTGLTAVFHTMMREPLLILIYLGIAVMLSWQLTLISFVVFPLALLVIAYVGRRVHIESGMVQERIASITSVLQETISGVKVVKAFGMEEFENRSSDRKRRDCSLR
jgi:subfamily B ATP-binding cassette protein MsbA